MKKGRFWLVAAGFLAIHSLLWAQVQWLNYHTSERAGDIIGSSRYYHQTQTEAPAGVKLAKLETDEPVFYKWTTTMDPKGCRWIVFDRKHRYGLYDMLYIDSDGDGALDDEKAIEGRQSSQYEVEFGGVPVYFEGEDGPITYHLNIGFYSSSQETRYATVSAGCWYEGQVEINGQATRCVLADYNANGSFNDKSDDRILLGPAEKYHTGWVGNYIEIDDALYRLNIAKDGAFVELTAAPEVPYGTITMPESITAFSAYGDNGMFERKVENGKVTLPEGRYRVGTWEIARKDDKGVDWKMQGSGFPQDALFTVVEQTPVQVDIGEPVFSRLEANASNDTHYFNQELVGKSGESISLTKDGRTPPAPRIHVRNKTGEYDRTFALEYG